MSWLVANTATATALAALVLLVGRFVRPAPAAMHVLWLFVLLKLVTPPLFAVPIELPWTPPATTPRTVVLPLTTSFVPVDVEPLVSTPSATPTPAPRPALAPRPRLVPGAARVPVAPTWTLRSALVLLWAAGALTVLLAFVHGASRTRARLRRLPAVPRWLGRELQTLAERMGVTLPELRDDPHAGSPYVWSFGRTCLVLPVDVLARATPAGRAAVLVHELAHLRRNDHWLAHGEVLFAAALWWHPLFWFARARLRAWAELACDAWAIALVPEGCHDYAAVLVDAVARPDPAVPASIVLAARPTAVAAFERRLTMILNENVPCRASAAWWLPFTALAAGLFAMPVAAQKPPQEPARIEIQVNGKPVERLSSAERTALLEQLLAAERAAPAAKAGKPAKAEVNEKPAKPGKNGRAPKAKPMPLVPPLPVEVEVTPEPTPIEVVLEGEAMPEVQVQLQQGLAEAKRELLADEDLRELGITDEVVALLDAAAAGKSVDGALDGLIRSALRGVARQVEQELRADPDLQELGLTEGVLRFVHGLLNDEGGQAQLSGLVRSLFAEAKTEGGEEGEGEGEGEGESVVEEEMHEVRAELEAVSAELQADPDLRELGIAEEAGKLVESLLRGGEFEARLQALIERAMRGAHRSETSETPEPEAEVAPPPAPAPKVGKRGKAARRGEAAGR